MRQLSLYPVTAILLSTALWGCATPSNEPCPPGGCDADQLHYEYEDRTLIQIGDINSCADVADSKAKAECKRNSSAITKAIKKHHDEHN